MTHKIIKSFHFHANKIKFSHWRQYCHCICGVLLKCTFSTHNYQNINVYLRPLESNINKLFAMDSLKFIQKFHKSTALKGPVPPLFYYDRVLSCIKFVIVITLMHLLLHLWGCVVICLHSVGAFIVLKFPISLLLSDNI